MALTEFAKMMERLERGVTPQELADAEAMLQQAPCPRQGNLFTGGRS